MSEYDMISELSTIISFMRFDAMETLREYSKEVIKNIQFHIKTPL